MAIKVIELRKAISAALTAVHARVYFQDAPDGAVYPYLVYDLPNSTDDGTLEQFVVDVDGWDDKPDTTALETLMSAADTALHRKSVVVTNGPVMTFYRDNRLAPIDDDPRIKRRRYTYQARTFERS